MKNFARVIFNIFWVLLIGLSASISNALLGVSLCLTIIGIPFGIQNFKFIALVFAPAGKVVVTRFSRHPVLNVFWLLLGGLEMAVFYWLVGLLLAVTIIGWPIASQLFKIARFNIAPFGAEILQEGEYSSKRNLEYDYDLLTRRIVANGDVVIGINPDGTEQTVEKYINGKGEKIGKLLREKRKNGKSASAVIFIVGIIALMLPFVVLWCVNKTTEKNVFAFFSGPETLSVILSGFLLFFGSCAFAVVVVAILSSFTVKSPRPILDFYATELRFLMDYYPKGSKEMNHSGIGDALAKYVDYSHLAEPKNEVGK